MLFFPEVLVLPALPGFCVLDGWKNGRFLPIFANSSPQIPVNNRLPIRKEIGIICGRTLINTEFAKGKEDAGDHDEKACQNWPVQRRIAGVLASVRRIEGTADGL